MGAVSVLKSGTTTTNLRCFFYKVFLQGPVLMEVVLKIADISVLSNFLAILFRFFFSI